MPHLPGPHAGTDSNVVDKDGRLGRHVGEFVEGCHGLLCI